MSPSASFHHRFGFVDRGWWMLACLSFVLFHPSLPAYSGSPVPAANSRITSVSQSGQFIIVGPIPRSAAVGSVIPPVGENARVSLRPDLLAVTCERVRHAVNVRLGFPNRRGVPVRLEIRPGYFEGGPLTIHPRLFSDGWNLFAELPDNMDWPQLVRLLVEAVVLDHFNRENPGEPVVLPPLWLTEGLTGWLMAESGRDLVAEPQTVTIRAARRRDPIAIARKELGGTGPLSFTELSQATADHFHSPDSYERFRASSTLFVGEVTRDERGRKMLREFSLGAHHYLNWQNALIHVSQGQFRSLLDIEKWWAVAAVDVTGRDPSQYWPRDRVVTELSVLLTETADIPSSNRPPSVRRTVPLHEVVQNWSFKIQQPVLRRKLGQLRLLSLHAPPDISPLISEAILILDEYLTTRDSGAKDREARMELETRVSLLVRNTVRRLVQLDSQVATAMSAGRSR